MDKVIAFNIVFPYSCFVLIVVLVAFTAYLQCTGVVMLSFQQETRGLIGRLFSLLGVLWPVGVAVAGSVTFALVNIRRETHDNLAYFLASEALKPLVICLGAGTWALYSRIRWPRPGGWRAPWAVLAGVVGTIGVLLFPPAFQHAREFSEAFDIASIEGVNILSDPTPEFFPAEHFARKARAAARTSEDVRGIMRFPHLRYFCPAGSLPLVEVGPPGDTEMYVYLSDNPNLGQSVIVEYDAMGTFERAGVLGGSEPRYPIQNCKPS